MRTLSLLLLLAGMPVILVGCFEDDEEEMSDAGPGGTDGGPGDSDGGPDGADGGVDAAIDGGVDAGPGLDLEAGDLLDVAPATLPEVDGGAVTVLLRATASTEDGTPVELEAAVAETGFTAAFADGSEAAAGAEVVEDGVLALSFDVPAGLAPDTGAPTVVALRADGAPFAEVRVGLHVDPAPLIESLAGDRTGIVHGGAGLTICHTVAADADEDGLAEVLVVGVEGADLVLRGCTRAGGEDDWTCADQVSSLDPERGADLVCGETDHFLTDGGEVGVTGYAWDAEGRLLTLPGMTWDGEAWSGTGAATSSTAIFGVVLGMNTTKNDPAAPIDALLGMSETGGRWTGTYQDGREPWTWTRMGTVTSDMIGRGRAWAGLFTDHDLSHAETSDTTWAWTLDPSRVIEGGNLVVDVLRFSRGSSGFVRDRQVELSPPDFTVEAAAAAGEDLDGDGVPELIVELWGEGRWAAWLIPAASDRASALPPRRLAAATDLAAYAVRTNFDGSYSVPQSSFYLSRRSGEMGNVGSNPMYQDRGTEGENPFFQALIVGNSWQIAEAMEADRAEVGASGGGVLGKERGGRATCASSVGGRGVCIRGRCGCPPGYRGASSMLAGGGDGSSAVTAAAGQGLVLAEDPGGDALVFAVLDGAARREFTTLRDGEGVVALSHGMGSTGPSVFLGETELLPASWDARVAAINDDGEGDLAVFVFEPQYLEPSGGDDAVTTTIRFDGRIRFRDSSGAMAPLPTGTTQGGTTVPVVLADGVSEDGGALLSWRDGEGQTWLGVLDVVEASRLGEDAVELPFLDGPVAVGAPIVDPDGALGLSEDNRGAVFLDGRSPGSGGGSPEGRLGYQTADWDEPLSRGLERGEGTHGPAALLVGDEDRLVRTIYLPAVEALTDLAPVDLTEPQAPGATVPVPRLVASLLPAAPAVLVMVDGEGASSLHLVDDAGRAASRWSFHVWNEDWSGEQRVSAADFNGDGLADLHVGLGALGEVVLGDGEGGSLASSVPARSLTNFDRAHERGVYGQECPVNTQPTFRNWTAGDAVLASSRGPS